MNVDKLALARAKYLSNHIYGSVLDVGANTMILKPFVKGKYTSLDIEGNADIIASAEAIPIPDNEYDTVVMSEVIEHVNNPGLAVKECFRVSSGRVIITTPNPFRLDYLLEWILRKNDIASKFHLCRFSENEMKAIVSKHGKIESIEHRFLEIPTFSRLGSLSFNTKNRFGSCSIYICKKRRANVP